MIKFALIKYAKSGLLIEVEFCEITEKVLPEVELNVKERYSVTFKKR